MVRGSYNWNRIFDDGAGTLDFLFLFSGLSGDLGGHPRLPSNWIADFRRLYDFGQAGRADLTVPSGSSTGRCAYTMLVNPLGRLPGFPRKDANLASRNLRRARMVTLATGQQRRFLRSRGLEPGKLTNAQIRAGKRGATLDGLTNQQRTALIRNTPLWFYVLREAEHNAGSSTGSGRGSSPRPSTARWRGAGRRSCAPGVRRSGRTTAPSAWSISCSSRSRKEGPAGTPRLARRPLEAPRLSQDPCDRELREGGGNATCPTGSSRTRKLDRG